MSVKGYKAMTSDMTCRDFKFEVDNIRTINERFKEISCKELS